MWVFTTLLMLGIWRSTSLTGQRRSNHLTIYAASSAVQTDAPVAFQEFLAGASNRRTMADLSGFSRMRVIAGGGVVGASGTVTEIWYSIDGGTNFLTMNCSVAIDASVGHITIIQPGSWAAIPPGAKRDVILVAGTRLGNATADPAFGHIVVEMQ